MFRRAVSGIILALLLVNVLTLVSNIQPVKASGTIYIRADGSIDPLTTPISSADNVTYTFTDNINDSIIVERSNIIIDGSGYLLRGTGASESRGISISAMNNVTVRNMNIDNFHLGIYCSSAFLGVISENNIRNAWAGIQLDYSSNNTISDNDLIANYYVSVYLFISSNNTLYHNNFSGWMTAGAPVNTWDNGYPSGGNYWSYYTGQDHYSGPYQNQLGSDGIGDTPYTVNEGNMDHYPLMQPVHIQVSTLLTFDKPSYPFIVDNKFNVTIVLENVSDLDCWQVSLNFDPNIVEYVNVSIPSDNVFANQTLIIGGPDTNTVGYVTIGACPLEIVHFNGSGKLCTFTFTGKSTGNTSLTFANLDDDTFILNSSLSVLPLRVADAVAYSILFQGDVNNDGIVNMRDVNDAVLAFNSFLGGVRWNPNADIDNSNRVDMRDLVMIVLNFNQHE